MLFPEYGLYTAVVVIAAYLSQFGMSHDVLVSYGALVANSFQRKEKLVLLPKVIHFVRKLSELCAMLDCI